MTRFLTILLFGAALATGAQAQSLYLNLNGNQVMGGTTLSGVVALTNPAPSTGAVVQLYAGPGVSVPPTVTIAAGQASAAFDISTFNSASPESVRIQASYGAASQSAYLQILATPPPPQAPPSYAGPNPANQQAGWNAGAEATADLQAEESWNYAAPYSPYAAGGYWGAAGALRGYGAGYAGGYRGGYAGGRR